MQLDTKSSPLFRDFLPQALAVVVCVLLALGIILNVQMGGEASWFWYSFFFRHGIRLYADLHIPLQPLFVLENSLWQRMFGTLCIVTEIPSLLHALALIVGIYLVLRESSWPAWQRAIVLFGVFTLFVQATAYRFDDFHVLADIFLVAAFFGLLRIYRTTSPRSLMVLSAAIGIFAGFVITTRLNDGAALLAATCVCLPLLCREKRVLCLCVFATVALLTVLCVVWLTRDTLSAWLANSVIRASSTKGGTGSLLQMPFELFWNAVQILAHGGRKILVWCAALFAVGLLIWKYKSAWLRFVVPLQLALAAVSFAICPYAARQYLLRGTFIDTLTIPVIVFTYLGVLAIFASIAMRWARCKRQTMDTRWMLMLLPLAQMAASSVSTAGKTTQGFYTATGLFLLLFAVLHPFRRHAAWVNPSFVTLFALIGISGVSAKIITPYSWQHYIEKPMFQGRTWYRHPEFGPLYIDRDALAFNQAVRSHIGHAPAGGMLALPFAYPNYFCDAPPWHGYVQTFFDTSTRPVIEHLMNELNTDPPQWIVYQRQLDILRGAEWLYNHRQRLPQRDLDDLIMEKIASGQWQLVEKRDYLVGDGWYIIKTHP